MNVALITNYNINEKANAAMTVAERLMTHAVKILIPSNFRERIERMHKYRPYFRFESQQNVYNVADMIIVLDNGQVVAQGNHDELLASCEIYQEVYRSQKKGGEE